jgi:AraC family transcriptional activator of tynA and feaB
MAGNWCFETADLSDPPTVSPTGRWGVDPCTAPGCTAGPGGLSRIVGYLEANLDDPDLQPRQISAQLNVSVRQMHRLFSATGLTIGAWVRRERLARCAADMRNPALRDLTLTDIAFRWGFNEAGHFSRCFKQQYGVTPRCYRAFRAQA